MSSRHHPADQDLLTLAFLSTTCLLFNMVAQPLHRDEIFLRRDTLSLVEVVMLTGFFLVFIFDIASVTWLAGRCSRLKSYRTGNIGTLALGALCVVLLFADKVMADEMGREIRLGWETLGEWFLLYCMLMIQLTYNLVFIVQLLRLRHVEATARHLTSA